MLMSLCIELETEVSKSDQSSFLDGDVGTNVAYVRHDCEKLLRTRLTNKIENKTNRPCKMVDAQMSLIVFQISNSLLSVPYTFKFVYFYIFLTPYFSYTLHLLHNFSTLLLIFVTYTLSISPTTLISIKCTNNFP